MPVGSMLTEIRRDPEELLTPADVGAMTKLGRQTLANMRWRRTGPAYVKLGRGRAAPVRYRRRDVEQWLHTRTTSSV
ncbi:helix-turn-helix transcriptional regulator [Streptomyces wuyuanensis]|uniref:helix-turn-helix transcriptional regulator n=1 Tax=Streptomyces wuyuanensis TaxID=1196353 RepID=UPI003715CB9C